jgi:hypothetical protein
MARKAILVRFRCTGTNAAPILCEIEKMKPFIVAVLISLSVYWSWSIEDARTIIVVITFILTLNLFEALEKIGNLEKDVTEMIKITSELKNAEDLRQLEKEVSEHNYFSTE